MATLQDVAQEANVSISTVSRALNNSEKVHPETKAHVRAVANELGYKRSRVARRLRLKDGKASLIGLVIPDIQNPFFADVTRGVEDIAQAQNYGLLLSNSDEDPDKQRLALDILQTEDVDGVIVPPVSEKDPALCQLVETDIAVVCVDRRLRNARVDTIISDNREGAYRAVSHLIDLGHERIAFIGGVPHISTLTERQQGYKQALTESGMPIDSKLVKQANSGQERGRRFTEELLELQDPPTAIFSGNNLTTLGVLAALNEQRVAVPEEMAVVGYDDVPWAQALNPPPTVVDQAGYEMGRRAAEILVERLQHPGRAPTTRTLEPELIVRRSCGASRRS